MENFIKEAKNGFYFDKTDSSSFLENHARMMVSLLAYNIVNFMKTVCLPAKEAAFQVILYASGFSKWLENWSEVAASYFLKQVLLMFSRICSITCWIKFSNYCGESKFNMIF